MIRIEKDKLIIEINCKGYEPLALLAEYQKSFIDLLHIANITPGQHSEKEVSNAMHFSTNLLNEMIINEDQNAILNKSLSDTQIKEFNKWCK